MMAQNMTILFIVIILIIVGIIYTRVEHDKQFEKWFEEVLKQAHEHGYTMEEIQSFQEIFWWDYFCLNMSPEEAIKQYKLDN